MVEKRQAVIEYRTGLFYGDNYRQALANLRKRYNPSNNARLQLHSRSMLIEGETVVMGQLQFELTTSLANLKKTIGA